MDTGSSNGIFVWIGKESSKEERVQAMKLAEAYLDKNGLPKWTKVCLNWNEKNKSFQSSKIILQIERVVDNGEPAMFKQYFKTWKEPEDSPFTGLGRVYPMETIAEWQVPITFFLHFQAWPKMVCCSRVIICIYSFVSYCMKIELFIKFVHKAAHRTIASVDLLCFDVQSTFHISDPRYRIVLQWFRGFRGRQQVEFSDNAG